MKRLMIVLLLFFIQDVKANDFEGRNYYCSDNFSTGYYVAQMEVPFRIKPNTEYTFYYYEDDWDNSNYFQKLRLMNIIKNEEEAKLELITSTKKIKRSFSVYQNKMHYVSFKTTLKDYYIYSMSFYSTEEMLLYYRLIEGNVDSAYNGNLNCEYLGEIEGSIPFDYTCSYDVSEEVTIEMIRDSLNINNMTKVIYDNYTKKKVGKYKIIFYEINDDEVDLCRVEIEITDQLPPVIIGKNEYKVDVKTPLAVKDILENLDITDNYLPYPNREVIYNSYLGNENKPGEYYIKVRAFDTFNNETIYTITINVYLSLSEAFCFKGRQFNKNVTDSLTKDQIRKIIINNLEKNDISYKDFSFDASNYNDMKEGEYTISFSYVYNDKTIDDYIKVCVKENDKYFSDDYHLLSKKRRGITILYIIIIIATATIAAIYFFWKYFKYLIVDKLFRK